MGSMSKKTRYFVATAAAILAVGLTTGLVASYMGLPVAFTSAAGPDELQYVPADAAVVAYANVREIMDSQFRERFRQFEPDTSERDEFRQKTGVNIETDIDTVVAAMIVDSTQTPTHSPKGMLILARGTFNQGTLEELATQHGGTIEDYPTSEGVKRLITHTGDQGEPAIAIGFLEADLIAIGGYDAIKKAIDAKFGRNVVSVNGELMSQISQLDASNAWAVGRFDAIANNAPIPSEIRAYLPAIQWFSAATHINGGVSGVFKAEARDDESAKNIRDIMNGLLALAKMQANSTPELKTMVDTLQLTGEGKNIALSFTVPSELFDALEQLKKLEQAR
jgi:DNA gyrase inhibitor GyrI